MSNLEKIINLLYNINKIATSTERMYFAMVCDIRERITLSENKQRPMHDKNVLFSIAVAIVYNCCYQDFFF
jgi:hypothetical protein